MIERERASLWSEASQISLSFFNCASINAVARVEAERHQNLKNLFTYVYTNIYSSSFLKRNYRDKEKTATYGIGFCTTCRPPGLPKLVIDAMLLELSDQSTNAVRHKRHRYVDATGREMAVKLFSMGLRNRAGI